MNSVRKTIFSTQEEVQTEINRNSKGMQGRRHICIELISVPSYFIDDHPCLNDFQWILVFLCCSHLVALGQPSWAHLWLPWASSPARQKPCEWLICYRRGTCCHQAQSLPQRPASHRTCRRSIATQSKLWWTTVDSICLIQLLYFKLYS